MGKSLSFTANSNLQKFAPIISSHHTPKRKKLVSLKPAELKFESNKSKMEESSLLLDGRNRIPLSHVVSDCLTRWFLDTLKEAKAGDTAMQVLLGQMYLNGYGVSKDSQKGLAWISRASKSRASAWKVSNKRPGYNASDSDSDEAKDNDNNTR